MEQKLKSLSELDLTDVTIELTQPIKFGDGYILGASRLISINGEGAKYEDLGEYEVPVVLLAMIFETQQKALRIQEKFDQNKLKVLTGDEFENSGLKYEVDLIHYEANKFIAERSRKSING